MPDRRRGLADAFLQMAHTRYSGSPAQSSPSSTQLRYEMKTHSDSNVSIFDPSRRRLRPPGIAASRLVLVVPTLELPRHHPDVLFAAVCMIQALDPDELVRLGDSGEPLHVENRYLETLRRSYRGALGFQFSPGLNVGKYDITSLPPTNELDVNRIAVGQPAVLVAIGPVKTALRAAIASGRSVVTAADPPTASVRWRDGDVCANRFAKEAVL